MNARTAAAPVGYLFMPPLIRRARFLIWLRRTHAWLGLWGAGLALLFGATGFLLNHRLVMKVPGPHVANSVVQVPLGEPRPRTPEALALELQRALAIDRHANLVRTEPAQEVTWNGDKLKQPEMWRVVFASPARTLNVEYWKGNAYATVKRQDPNAWALLTRLHMGTGATVAWVLLVDTLAGGLIALALTGMLLWSRLHGTRLTALAIGMGSIALTFSLAWQAL